LINKKEEEIFLFLILKQKSPRKAKGGKAAKLFSPLYQEGQPSLKPGARIQPWLVPLGKEGQRLLTNFRFFQPTNFFQKLFGF
ncbi:MAG: hypothetical protein LBD50_02350, partial [Rickettsiales bacterium]|nr:hypothetical protein [Rickettsiales bacterium]